MANIGKILQSGKTHYQNNILTIIRVNILLFSFVLEFLIICNQKFLINVFHIFITCDFLLWLVRIFKYYKY